MAELRHNLLCNFFNIIEDAKLQEYYLIISEK